MTSATETPDVRELLAERFGEDLDPLFSEATTGEAGRRARFIATMHALIAWLLAHPEVPCPWSIGISVEVGDVDALMLIATQLGIDPYRRPDGVPQQVTVFEPVNRGPDREFYTPISIHVATADRPL